MKLTNIGLVVNLLFAFLNFFTSALNKCYGEIIWTVLKFITLISLPYVCSVVNNLQLES